MEEDLKKERILKFFNGKELSTYSIQDLYLDKYGIVSKGKLGISKKRKGLNYYQVKLYLKELESEGKLISRKEGNKTLWKKK